MGIHEKLLKIQTELKAPKGQYNKFGNYVYRSCEDILESLKPILEQHKATLIIFDTIELVGNRHYIKAHAKLIDVENSEDNIEVTAYAREEESKKGMDASQITGSASSYARKYALNGLFCIDDTKDADTQDNRPKQTNNGSTNGETKVTTEMLEHAIKTAGFTTEKVIARYEKDSGKKVSELKFISQEYKKKYYDGFVKKQ